MWSWLLMLRFRFVIVACLLYIIPAAPPVIAMHTENTVVWKKQGADSSPGSVGPGLSARVSWPRSVTFADIRLEQGYYAHMLCPVWPYARCAAAVSETNCFVFVEQVCLACLFRVALMWTVAPFQAQPFEAEVKRKIHFESEFTLFHCHGSNPLSHDRCRRSMFWRS